MTNFPQIGKIAPNFLTIGVYKKRLGKIRLSDYRGKKYVILLFYPANFSAVSPTELIGLSDRISDFKKLSTQILAISVDSPFSHLRSLLSDREEGGLANLAYPLISDLTQAITNDYKLLTEDGLAFPGLFIIDKEGILQYYTVNNLLCGRSINELLRILESIQYVKKNPGQACPVDWRHGDPILYSHPLKSKIYFKDLYSPKKS
uniref:2-Cys peroxiredoxin n=1 Tax=Lithodesmium undulatum TaxID=59812 RepID=A0A023HB85_LITUN|nr:2-Cys peroxiredoxin [Lithodesmium undulatum]YP_009029549.1 2-Cys peroxiredoxin [Lithodesmium undulatum]AGH29022.1 2-Cys peroxiredoxin [Lithodesmium undulatum]AGH29080.1 2-Cys peroxiredoxin [Lithodesmium undulatum]UYC30438.1 2-Cys peroxiredoxin [Lithodesmium undulatum]UYC30496.1 2-Cys peroxiredoxin [Lithodesmium undulatum]